MTKTNYEKISILIPCFNAQKTLKKTINSALIQKYPNFDILISDNHSDDKSRLILQKIKKKNIKIYYQKKNMGAPKNWMFLTKKTNAKIIIFLGADDNFKDKYSLNNLYTNIKKKKTMCSAGGFLQDLRKSKNKIFLKNTDTNLSLMYNSIAGKYNFLWYGMWNKKAFQNLLKKFQVFQGLPELSLDRASMFFHLINYNLNFSTFNKICYVKKKKNKKSRNLGTKITNIFLEFFYSLKIIFNFERKNISIKILFICSIFIFNTYRLFYSLLRKSLQYIFLEQK